MKTEYKYISYREDKKLYVVGIRVNGKYLSRTFKSLDEAIKARTEFLRLHGLTGSLGVTNRRHVEAPTFLDGFKTFIEDVIVPRDTPATVGHYYVCRKMFGKYIGHMRIDAIHRELWQDVFTARQEKDPLNYVYMMDNYREIRDMYAYFVEAKIIDANPLERPLLFQRTQRVPRRDFTRREAKQFLTAAKSYDYGWFFLFAMYFLTGCRRGELVALRWQDVDFGNHCFHIRHSIAYGVIDGKRQEFLSAPKTASSVRDIPISDKAYFVLRMRYLREQPKPETFVFHRPNRSKYPWLSPSTVGYAFRYIRDLAGLDENLTLHCVRHTVASRLVTAGIDLATVQKIGGWSTPSTLLRVYAHSNDRSVRDAMEKVLFHHGSGEKEQQ